MGNINHHSTDTQMEMALTGPETLTKTFLVRLEALGLKPQSSCWEA